MGPPSAGRHEEADQRPHCGHGHSQPAAGHRRFEVLGEQRHPGGESLVVRRPHGVEHRASRRGGERVSRQGSRLVDGTAGRQLGQQVAPPAERAHRQSAPDDLAEAPEVGRDARPPCRPRRTEPEPGDDLVEDQQGAAGAARGTQPLEETGGRRHQVHVGGHGLDDHAGDSLVEDGNHVVRNDLGVGDRAGGHADRARQAEHGHPTAPARQQPVRVAVVAAVELDDPVASGGAAGQTDRAHGRLGPRGDEAHLLTARDARADGLGQQDLTGRRRAERRALGRRGRDGPGDHRVRMPEQHGSVGLHHVEVAVPLGVEDERALPRDNRVRRPADGGEGADGRVHPARNDAPGPLEPVAVRRRCRLSHRAPRPPLRRSRSG